MSCSVRKGSGCVLVSCARVFRVVFWLDFFSFRRCVWPFCSCWGGLVVGVRGFCIAKVRYLLPKVLIAVRLSCSSCSLLLKSSIARSIHSFNFLFRLFISSSAVHSTLRPSFLFSLWIMSCTCSLVHVFFSLGSCLIWLRIFQISYKFCLMVIRILYAVFLAIS